MFRESLQYQQPQGSCIITYSLTVNIKTLQIGCINSTKKRNGINKKETIKRDERNKKETIKQRKIGSATMCGESFGRNPNLQ